MTSSHRLVYFYRVGHADWPQGGREVRSEMVELQAEFHCPTCGTPLSHEGGSEGLCPGCLLELALDDTSLEAELDPGEARTLQFSAESFSEGQIQGERYRIRSLLGRGGMGEVWRAYDLKLRLDVALKALRTELIQSQEALETLRQEVRVAREVVSPNVCRVFDLEELDGQELISMEYIDGTTLQEILKERGPLDLNEAREIASQFLAGLEAIHEAGLVHRDIKPENLMLTRTGRVVVMDFGIAKGLGDGRSNVMAGTPAYMAPEQARGGELDPRADIFSAGIVLAEMVEPGGVQGFEDRKRVWEGIHRESPRVSDSPWTKVITQAVVADREARFATASALSRALEEVTLRAAGDETARPYPGLSYFQEEDAEFFFGRELEVEALWKKLRRPHLLAVIGPSGAGKSSFLRAGLLPTLTDGWQSIVATPGSRPFANLARALAEHLPADPATVEALLRFEEPEVAVRLISQWRQGHRHGLIILDQFEELFTQNPEATQSAFTEVLGVLPLKADVHVLLSMRDDFLMYCHGFEALRPLFSELSPLDPPLGAALRRALVQPALKCGYRFEDEALVEEMLGEVEGERGSLPMVAFSAARLWDRRDRDQGLLTREAYEQIGGVGGSLAQHAEATLKRIGEEHIPIVRELFRNLVTAQGTRAARDRDELVSVFGGDGASVSDVGEGSAPSRAPTRGASKTDRAAAEEVLNTLIDARLLTSYEVPGTNDEDTPYQRIEIIHESLLSAWPRWVRWQTQDADGAQLRDQLRQAAKMWLERGRPWDLLWTGSSFKEYELWRERYAGGLSDTEEQFAVAMKTKAERRKRQRRLTVGAAFAVLLAILAVVGVSRQQAVESANLAEAQKLLALGQLEIAFYPTVALAYATTSLELSDTPDVRLFALRALAAGPPATVLELGDDVDRAHEVLFSPDGAWAALRGFEKIQLVSRDGGTFHPLDPFSTGGGSVAPAFDPSGQSLYGAKNGRLRVWSVPEFRLVDEQTVPAGRTWRLAATPMGVFALTIQGDDQVITEHSVGAQPKLVGRIEAARWQADIDRSGRWLAFSAGNELYIRSLEEWNRPPRRIGKHRDAIEVVAFQPAGDRVAAMDLSGEVRIWSTRPEASAPLRALPTSRWGPAFDPAGRAFAIWGGDSAAGLWVDLWDLQAPVDATARVMSVALPGGGAVQSNGASFEPEGHWLATANINVVGFWPLARSEPRTLTGTREPVWGVEFTPDGDHLVSISQTGEVRMWELQAGGTSHTLVHVQNEFSQLGIDQAGRRLVVAQEGGALVVPLDEGSPQHLEGFAPSTWVVGAAIDPEGRLVAASALRGPRSEKVIRIWDLETDESWTLGPTDEAGEGFAGSQSDFEFLPGGRLVSVGDGGLRLWDMRAGTSQLLAPCGQESRLMVFGGGRWAAYTGEGYEIAITDLDAGTTRTLESHGGGVWPVAVDSTGTVIVSGSDDGTVRVGTVTGEEPHLLLGHEKKINGVAISPDGRWIASSSDDYTIRLWPMPDLAKPPLHTLPHEELLAKLRSLTNLRIVPDKGSSTGWKLNIGPFPGWAEVPRW